MQKSQCYNLTRVSSLSINPEFIDFQYVPCNHLPHSPEQHKTKINRIEKKVLKYLYSSQQEGILFICKMLTSQQKGVHFFYTVFIKRQEHLSEKSYTSRKRGSYSHDLILIFDRIDLQFPEP